MLCNCTPNSVNAHGSQQRRKPCSERRKGFFCDRLILSKSPSLNLLWSDIWHLETTRTACAAFTITNSLDQYHLIFLARLSSLPEPKDLYNFATRTYFSIASMSHLVVYTGNILQTKLLQPSAHLSKQLRNVLKSSPAASASSTHLETPMGKLQLYPGFDDYKNGTSTTSTTDAKPSSNEVSAKLFIPKGISVDQAVRTVQSAIQTFETGFEHQVKYFILSFGGIVFSDDEDDEENTMSDAGIYEIWKAAVEAGKNTRLDDGSPLIEQFGVSEFSSKRLQALLNNIDSSPTGVKPTIDHINAADCCALPQSLVTIAKSVGIKLLAHHDPENMVPQKEVDEIANEIRERAETKANEYQWDWILSMTHLAKDRQVLIRQEALVSFGVKA